MSESEMLWWTERDFAYRYLEEADVRILDRRRMLDTLKSFYRHFLGHRSGVRVLDLGCGDGVLTHEIMQVDAAISATLVDGSEDMLGRARERLACLDGVRFIRATFQELLHADPDLPEFDLAVSSLAIHHLNSSERRALFGYIFSHLAGGGYFVNIDLALAPAPGLEEWYVRLWRDWMIERERELGLEGSHDGVIGCCQEKEHHSRLDTLAGQMKALEEAGFKDVDCFYKNGIFAMYGGRKQSAAAPGTD